MVTQKIESPRGLYFLYAIQYFTVIHNLHEEHSSILQRLEMNKQSKILITILLGILGVIGVMFYQQRQGEIEYRNKIFALMEKRQAMEAKREDLAPVILIPVNMGKPKYPCSNTEVSNTMYGKKDMNDNPESCFKK